MPGTHTAVAPVIAPGVAGGATPVIENDTEELVPQGLPAVTFSVPLPKEALKVIVTTLVPCPLAIEELEGTVHV